MSPTGTWGRVLGDQAVTCRPAGSLCFVLGVVGGRGAWAPGQALQEQMQRGLLC